MAGILQPQSWSSNEKQVQLVKKHKKTIADLFRLIDEINTEKYAPSRRGAPYRSR